MKVSPIHLCSIEYWETLFQLVLLVVSVLVAAQELVEVEVE